MRLAAIALAAVLPVLPATAQEAEEEGRNLMEEGARMFLRGLTSEMEPALDDLRGFADEIQPALRELSQQMGGALATILERIDDIRYYQAPEILPNGDIIIRRRPDAPPWEPEESPEDAPEVGEDGEVDL